jgi:phosphonoacetaldehyde hydrolase
MNHLKAVVFDWAGTIVDFGSRAPMGAFVKVFGDFGVTITIDEARGPMGMAKRDHISALIYAPEIAARWVAAHGKAPTEADIDRIYQVFVPLNARVVTDFADFIPGAVEVVATLRSQGLKIGSTTGYTREIMENLLPVAAAAGYAPDNLVCAGDLAQGRPSPLMMYRCFADLGVFPPHAVVKVDDTEPGIAEGLAAGCWTVAVAVSGNAFGHSRSEVEAMSPDAFSKRRAQAYATLAAAGAHVVIDSVADLLPVLMDFDQRIAKGERPA